jgi:hypothetical protein
LSRVVIEPGRRKSPPPDVPNKKCSRRAQESKKANCQREETGSQRAWTLSYGSTEVLSDREKQKNLRAISLSHSNRIKAGHKRLEAQQANITRLRIFYSAPGRTVNATF